MANENEIEFYVIRKNPHERELIAAVCQPNGGYVYYNFLSNSKNSNTNELLHHLTNSSSSVKIQKIDSIEKYIDINNDSVVIHPLNINDFRTQIICDRLSYFLKKYMEEENLKAKSEDERLQGAR